MSPAAQDARLCWGLLTRRPCLLPTWRGWVILAATWTGLFAAIVHQSPSFLALQRPVYGGVLVVEGWAPDYALAAAVHEFQRHPYQKLYVTGGPLERGSLLAEYRTHAELGAAVLVKMGLDPTAVQAVPAPPVQHDRTYASAVALRRWLKRHGAGVRKYHVLSLGAHARRTRLLFQEALGPDAVVGVTALECQEYSPRQWWKTSAGVRDVISEMIAYAYAKFLFHPAPE